MIKFEINQYPELEHKMVFPGSAIEPTFRLRSTNLVFTAPSIKIALIAMLCAPWQMTAALADETTTGGAPTPGPKPVAETTTTSEVKPAATSETKVAETKPNIYQTRPVNEKILPLIKEGYFYLSKGANDKAIKVLRKACALDPECISGRRYLAYALVKQHEYKPALSELQKVSKLVPPNAFDFYLFGEAYYGANGMKEAHDCYNEALNQNKAYAAARVGLVKTFARQNKFEDAFNTLQEGMQSTNDAAVKRYYASLTKAVTEAQAVSKSPTALIPATSNTQIGSDSVKSAPVVLK